MGPVAREFAGLALIVVGALGCVLPVIPGLPILAAGAFLLGPKHPIIERGRSLIGRVRGGSR